MEIQSLKARRKAEGKSIKSNRKTLVRERLFLTNPEKNMFFPYLSGNVLNSDTTKNGGGKMSLLYSKAMEAFKKDAKRQAEARKNSSQKSK